MTARRRTPTQLVRVLQHADRHGRVSQADFDAPTCDGFPPARRVASRIVEAKALGWEFDTSTREHSMVVYKVLRRGRWPRDVAARSATPPEPSEPVATLGPLFEAPAPLRRSSYYDAETTA